MYSHTSIKPTKFRVFKHSITEYVVEAYYPFLNKWVKFVKNYKENLVLYNCTTIVVPELVEQIQRENLQADKAPLCAWIECESFDIKKAPAAFAKKLYFNPFKVKQFQDKKTGEKVKEASLVLIHGNSLSYL